MLSLCVYNDLYELTSSSASSEASLERDCDDTRLKESFRNFRKSWKNISPAFKASFRQSDLR